MKKWMIGGAVIATLTFAGCREDGLDAVTTVDSSFETDTNGWTAGFAEYSTKTDTASLALRQFRGRLPAGQLDSTQYAFVLSSHNRADDIFMYLKKKVTGFVPNRTYRVVFDVNFGTKYPGNSMGIGGSPGSSVYMKVGATTVEPTQTVKGGFYEFNLDKGNQSQSGKDAIVIGDIASSRGDTLYSLENRSNAGQPITVRPDASGTIWLLLGTDSGFEGLTTLYYNRITATITEQP